MRNSFQVVGLSIILWFGLNTGLLNAAILSNTEIGSDSILASSEIIDQAFKDFEKQIISTDESEMGSTAVANNFDLAINNESISQLELTENGNTAPDYEAISNQTAFVNFTDPTPTVNTSSPIASNVNAFTDTTTDTENESFLPERGAFAMLLIGIGLLALTARSRKDVI